MHSSLVVLFGMAVLLVSTESISAATFGRSQQANINLEGVDDDALEVFRRLELERFLQQAAPIESVKRTLDLGFSRGFSGSQAAKHLMGLAAANFAGGPGRRKRSPAAEKSLDQQRHDELQN